jgi:hypothetical protein
LSLPSALVPARSRPHGELIFQLGAERAAPGDVLEVRGDVGAGSTVEIVLISKSDGLRRSIATLTDYEEGHFQGFVTIPPEVTAGDYLVEATTESISMGAPLTVIGYPAGEGGERPDQAEPLLVPLPSDRPDAAFETSTAVRVGPGTTTATREAWPLPSIWIAVLVVLAAVALLTGLRLAAGLRPRIH